MGAYNATKHSTTRFTPFKLWFGREQRVPITMLFPMEDAGKKSPQVYVAQLAKRAARLHRLTRTNLQEAQIRQKKNFDKNVTRLRKYAVGDQVMVLVKVVPKGGKGKLLRAWQGPFTINEVKQQGRYFILDSGMIAHYERVKPYYARPTEIFANHIKEQEIVLPEEEGEELRDQEVIPPALPSVIHDDSDDTFHSDASSQENLKDTDVEDEEEEEEKEFEPVPRGYGTVRLRNMKPVQYWKLVQPQSFRVAAINECKDLTPYSTPEWMEREQLQNEKLNFMES